MPGKPNEQKGRKAAKSNFVKSNTRSKELGTEVNVARKSSGYSRGSTSSGVNRYDSMNEIKVS